MIYHFSLIASVILGYAFARIFPMHKIGFSLLLVFSGSFLFAITIFHLLPEIYSHSDAGNIGIYVMIGVLVQIVLEFFSKGVEHGHVHLSSEKPLSMPLWTLFAGLSIHSALEGLPIAYSQKLIYGVVIHKFPIAIVLSTLLIKLKKKHPALIMFCFAIMTPMGLLLGQSIVPDKYHTEVSALVAGALLHVSSVILFESSKNHEFNLKKLVLIIAGFVGAYALYGID